jgi:hypothetical protein
MNLLVYTNYISDFAFNIQDVMLIISCIFWVINILYLIFLTVLSTFSNIT